MIENDTIFDRLQERLWSFAEHRVITVAGKTGILAELANGPVAIESMAQKLSLAAMPAGKIVRALTALGLAEATGEEYALVSGLKEIFTPGPRDFTPFLEHSHFMYDRWGQSLEPWLRGEKWGTQKRDPSGIKRFDEAMKAMGGQIARRAADLMDLTRVEKMLDVGGGTGTYSIEFAKRAPNLRAVVLDMPEVADHGRELGKSTDMSDRVEFTGGDYMDPDCYGEGHDLVLMANVLHQETVERASTMVRLGAGALSPGGMLAVIDFSIDEERRENILGTLFAINMRSFGDTYPESVIHRWFSDAGLDDHGRIDIDSNRWILYANKPTWHG
jgi:ubiquinone/menaquinone biosynthesis C-methylase UbiE